jgi:hypothetical protein
MFLLDESGPEPPGGVLRGPWAHHFKRGFNVGFISF